LGATVLALLSASITYAFAQQSPTPDSNSPAPPPPAAQRDEIDILGHPPETDVPPSPPVLPEIKIPNFASCSIAELQKTVHELAHLKVAEDQSQLAGLLDKIGAKVAEVAHKTPNLISNEAVVSEQGGIKTHQSFSFLVLRHDLGPKGVVFDEYRVDPSTGKKFQTEESESATASNSSASGQALPFNDLPLPGSDGPPTSQGFVNGWLNFYPANRRLSDFRYLGQQKMDGHQTLVVVFAQKPAAVQVPGTVSFENKTAPVFLQGVAWVDPSDFRIVRLRTDLLSQPHGIPLHQLTAEIQFMQTAIAEVASPLWLPRQVLVTTSLGGTTVRERHTYSSYRLFRAKAKILLNP
jgi:hypothetical protein